MIPESKYQVKTSRFSLCEQGLLVTAPASCRKSVSWVIKREGNVMKVHANRNRTSVHEWMSESWYDQLSSYPTSCFTQNKSSQHSQTIKVNPFVQKCWKQGWFVGSPWNGVRLDFGQWPHGPGDPIITICINQNRLFQPADFNYDWARLPHFLHWAQTLPTAFVCD